LKRFRAATIFFFHNVLLGKINVLNFIKPMIIIIYENAPDVVSKAKKSFSVEPIKIQQKQDPFLFEIYFDEILLVLYPLFFCIIFFILPFWIVMGSAISSNNTKSIIFTIC
jgi:hypothetical protein